ncbi:DNA repair protein RecO [Giesbergeria anulus]|uniref:DNA repair protein RecO n=1 Tax=Giesbergeria anulus TaxID=180197 RepID=A0A1H9I5F8_9BURK|nr:DNA repair protein RecO [Giesbergeria anulus]SEQ69665.1 DNA replication and repair protein RecO [Giesbergeria anulus]
MATARRFSHEPAFVLHRYDWSESSLILEVFTRHHGRTALVARGAKKPSSNFRPVLLPLQPLSLHWTESASPATDGSGIHPLKGAEWVGGHILPMGDALLSGTYLNELLLRLLARHDPHPALFDAYAAVVRVLASEHGEALEPVLRAFELLLLRELGLLPALNAHTLTLAPVQEQARYALLPDSGLCPTPAQERASLSGAQWLQLNQALEGTGVRLSALLQACAPVAAELKPQLRTLLQYHCGAPLLRTRQLMMDMQTL